VAPTTRPDGFIERELHAQGFALVGGTDEVGRGALAGPLVAAAVILPTHIEFEGLRDSKLLTPTQREKMAAWVHEHAVAISIVRITPKVIDQRGLHKSNIRALRRAIYKLDPRPSYALTDGFPVSRMPVPALSIKKGDRVSATVAAASIVAKVFRDRSMRRLHRRYPAFGFARNKGYGTGEHWRALREHGPSDVHRFSFKGVGVDGTIVAESLEDWEEETVE
jgi:ribonuclease HII